MAAAAKLTSSRSPKSAASYVAFAGTESLPLSGMESPEPPTTWNSARGSGVGKAMRRAVLALAFGPLGARAAVTSAWHDNHGSLGVSRSIGYLPNGESLMARDGGADTLVHLRMTRKEWDATGAAAGVAIDGFEPCRPYFGLGPARA